MIFDLTVYTIMLAISNKGNIAHHPFYSPWVLCISPVLFSFGVFISIVEHPLAFQFHLILMWTVSPLLPYCAMLSLFPDNQNYCNASSYFLISSGTFQMTFMSLSLTLASGPFSYKFINLRCSVADSHPYFNKFGQFCSSAWWCVNNIGVENLKIKFSFALRDNNTVLLIVKKNHLRFTMSL